MVILDPDSLDFTDRTADPDNIITTIFDFLPNLPDSLGKLLVTLPD